MTTLCVVPEAEYQRELLHLADEINTEYRLAEADVRKGIEHARRTGELLILAKDKVGHGKFLKWLGAHCDISERMARYCMQVAKGWEQLQSKTATVADLTFREATKLLAPEHALVHAMVQEQEPEDDIVPEIGDDAVSEHGEEQDHHPVSSNGRRRKPRRSGKQVVVDEARAIINEKYKYPQLKQDYDRLRRCIRESTNALETIRSNLSANDGRLEPHEVRQQAQELERIVASLYIASGKRRKGEATAS
jgi:hypothetical protein